MPSAEPKPEGEGRPKDKPRISRTPLAPPEDGHHAERDEYGSDLSAHGEPPPAAKQPPAVERSTIGPAAIGPRGISPQWLDRETAPPSHAWIGPEPENVQTFFALYFAMTGLHGVHVLAGMAAIAWLLVRARRGEFSPAYFTPVDFTGLYWHLVDLVWIFLFPLFYLIA